MKILLLAENKEWADFWINENRIPKKLVQYISQPTHAFGLHNLPYVVLYGLNNKTAKIAEILSWGKCYQITTDQAKEIVMHINEAASKLTAEEEYLRCTRIVNNLKDQINEAEKEKIELIDRIHVLENKIDEIDKEYRTALNAMLTASTKVK